MSTQKITVKIARAIVAVLCLGLVEVGVVAPSAQAAAPSKPTITSITSGESSLTVNMASSGMGDASSWRWSVSRSGGVSCANTYGDGSVQSTGSLTSTIEIVGLTSGCTYKVKVAAYNGVIGEYVDGEKLVGAFTNGLNAYYKNEVGISANATYVPFTSGTCGSGVVSNIDIDYGSNGPSGCNSDGFTTYYVGYLKAPYTGSVTFRNSSDDGFYLNIQGQNVIAYATESGPQTYNSSGSITMVTGEIYRFEAWHHEYTVGAAARLFWDWSGQATTIVPSSNLATDPSVFFGTCPLGSAARCSAGSALEIKQATGTNMDGLYWIDVNGVPTLTYCIMNSAMSGGGWMLAMKGKKAASTLDYGDSLWTNSSTLNADYPQRWKNGDTPSNTYRDIDAKYGVFAHNKANQILALFPEQNSYAGGAIAAGTTGNTTEKYGFSWLETTTAMRPWTSYNASAVNGNPAGWGGTSWNVAHTGGPTAVPTCVNTATTLSNLFSTASRCAFRQVSNTYSASESPYSAVGNNLFYTQDKIRFFGINYGSANTGNRDRARIGFGWNENDAGNESSNDGTGGIGIDRQGYSSITAGSINNCCETPQGGISGVDNGSSTNIPFELYIRNSITASLSVNNLQVVQSNSSSMIDGTPATVSGMSGSPTYRISPKREGISINSSTGIISVTEDLPIGSYSQTVSATDSDGVTAVRSITVEVISESGEEDRAISFNGSSNYLSTIGTFSLASAQTWELWVKANGLCSGSGNQYAVANQSINIFCKSYYWYVAVRNAAGSWSEVKLSQRVVDGEWAHLAFVYDGSNYRVYYNKAQLIRDSDKTSSWSSVGVYATASSILVGGNGASGSYFSGTIDEIKIWSEARTLTQIIEGAHSREALGNANLLQYWDFNEASGAARSRAQSSDSSFNLSPAPEQWTNVAVSSLSGAYTVITFPRTIITALGGWKRPDSVTAVTLLLVGGGGGGGWNTGGGGGGGAIVPINRYQPSAYSRIVVGTGGEGALGTGSGSQAFAAETGSATIFDNFSASGGNRGATYVSDTTSLGGAGITNSSGSVTTTSGSGGNGPASIGNGTAGGNGYTSSITGSALIYGSGGGGGAYSGTGGAGGSGAGTGGGTGGFPTGTVSGQGFDGAPNRGGGGGGSSTRISGGNGGSGVVILRYITALKPTFTSPTNAYLNVGMTETFTVNVAQDSATVNLTRTFRWESTTGGSGGTYSVIKEGTGAANAFFAWTPTDTSTSGSNYLYRVIVTDSDTAGLFIVETSTPVFAIINRALNVQGSSTIGKPLYQSKSETFTISLGTPTYRATLTQNYPGITLDTTTASSPIVRLPESMSVGTYYETLTVTDSVSARVITPLTIVVVAPPNLLNAGEIYSENLVLNLEAGNSGSLIGESGTATNGLRWNDLSGSGNHATTGAGVVTGGYTASNCVAPVYSSENGGVLRHTGDNCYYTTFTGNSLNRSYTAEIWFKLEGAIPESGALISQAYPAIGRNISIQIGRANASGLIVGFWDGTVWRYANCPITPTIGVWNHVVGTYNGSEMRTYLNGSNTVNGSACVAIYSGGLTGTTNNQGIIIGKNWHGSSNYGFPFSLGAFRLYSKALTASQVLANYNATKNRFLSANSAMLTPTQKYGTSTSESFTATSGYGVRSITSSASNKPALSITTLGDVTTLAMAESLTAITHYETITVTDSLGQSTYLPLSLVITKADTITVTSGPSLTTVYTGSAPNNGPVAQITGLVGGDSATVTTVYSVPCAQGGECSIGDLGPGGGRVFYISPSLINAATGVSSGGIYLEVAPRNWNGNQSSETGSSFATRLDSVAGTSASIGTGAENTRLLRSALGDSATAATLAMNATVNGVSDWFVPSYDELTRAITTLAPLGLGEFSTFRNLWSSTQNSSDSSRANNAWSSNPPVLNVLLKTDNYYLRPIRAFSPIYPIETSTPINVETYTARGGDITFHIGSLSNYQGVIYETSTLKITQAFQKKLTVNLYGAVAGQPFTIQTSGGSGDGAISETVTAGSTASNCRISNRILQNDDPSTLQRTCVITVTKAASRNYFAESLTATVYFMLFINNQPTGQMGSGSTIGINGATAISVESGTVPTITGPGAGSFAAGSTMTITGTGFTSGPITIKFYRNKLGTNIVVSSDTSLTVSIPNDASSGYITLTNSYGTVTSSFAVTITPPIVWNM